MKRVNYTPLILVLFICTVIGIAYASQEVADTFKIDYRDKFQKTIKPPVEFTHKKHHDEFKVACAECHHVYKDGKNVWQEGQEVQKCIECHSPDKKEAKAKKVLDLRNAFHKNCQTCHKDAVKQGKKAPVKCAQCHVQE